MRRISSATEGRISGSLKSSSGQSLVEFALIAPLFFLLIFGVLDFGRLFFSQMTLQHALREAGRYAVTGRRLSGTDPKTGQAYTRVGSIKQIAENAASGLNVTSISISSVQGGNGSAGGPGDTFTVSLTTNLKLITPIIGQFFGPNGTYTFTVSTTFKNEPFDPSQTN
jgi:Flp pilus assembly protein TadG